MARRREGPRVLGPYPHRRRWRILVVDEGGKKNPESYATKEEALAVIRSVKKLTSGFAVMTFKDALEEYEAFLVEKGNKRRSIDTTIGRFKHWFTDDEFLSKVSVARLDATYKRRRGEVKAADTHRNELSQAKTFLRWCAKKGWVSRSLAARLDEVEGVGKRKKGKAQLRINEARLFIGKALEIATAGETGAVAAMMCLLMGLRASEVVDRVVRDVDDDGRLLWIPEAKTEKGRRTVKVPELLRPFLLRLTEGKEREARLFGKHWRDWPREWVQRICAAAKVPVVTAHGMRGLHATLAEESGATGEMVAAALGHESVTTTHGNYTDPSAVIAARQNRALGVLLGGAPAGAGERRRERWSRRARRSAEAEARSRTPEDTKKGG